MAASRTRPGNPERGWNDPPMFNYNTEQDGSTQPKRTLNKRVAFPVSGNTKGPTPGHAVLNPSQGPPILNPVLPADIQGPPLLPTQPPVPIGLRDTPLGNQAAPQSPIQLLPPTADTSTPQTVPILVPLLVPSSPPKSDERVPEVVQLENERLEELLSRLSFDNDSKLLQLNLNNFESVLNKYRNILTLKVCDEIKKKLEVFEEKWKKGCFSDNVKVKITQLSTALLNGETEKANHLHLALMVDHIAEVSQWMMGVKRLLQQQQLANKEKEIISENQEMNDAQNQDMNDAQNQDMNDTQSSTCDQKLNEENLTAEGSSGVVPEETDNSDQTKVSSNSEELSGETTGIDESQREVTDSANCDKTETEKAAES